MTSPEIFSRCYDFYNKPASEGPWATVLDFMPFEFEAYVKIMHPVYRSLKPTSDFTWDEFLKSVGYKNPTIPASIQNVLEGSTTVYQSGSDENSVRWTWKELCQHFDVEYSPDLTLYKIQKQAGISSFPKWFSGATEGYWDVEFDKEMKNTITSALRLDVRDQNLFMYFDTMKALRLDIDFLFQKVLLEFYLTSSQDTPDFLCNGDLSFGCCVEYDSVFTLIGGRKGVVYYFLNNPNLESFEVDKSTIINWIANATHR